MLFSFYFVFILFCFVNEQAGGKYIPLSDKLFIIGLNKNNVSWKPNFSPDMSMEWQSLMKTLETHFQGVELPHATITYNEFGKGQGVNNNNNQGNFNSIDISRFGIDDDTLTEENIGEYIQLLKSSKTTRSMYFTVIDKDEDLYNKEALIQQQQGVVTPGCMFPDEIGQARLQALQAQQGLQGQAGQVGQVGQVGQARQGQGQAGPTGQARPGGNAYAYDEAPPIEEEVPQEAIRVKKEEESGAASSEQAQQQQDEKIDEQVPDVEVCN